MLFAVAESTSVAVTLAVLVTLPVAVAVTINSIEAIWLLARLPKSQMIVALWR